MTPYRKILFGTSRSGASRQSAAPRLAPLADRYFSHKRIYWVNSIVMPRLRANPAMLLSRSSSVDQLPAASLSIFRKPARTVSS